MDSLGKVEDLKAQNFKIMRLIEEIKVPKDQISQGMGPQQTNEELKSLYDNIDIKEDKKEEE